MTRVGAFLSGFLLAIVLVAFWVLAMGGSRETVDLTAVTPSARSASGKGLIGSTYENIAARVVAEREIVRAVRGNLRFSVNDFIWEDAGHPDFIRAREATGMIDTRAAAHMDIVLRGVNIRDAHVYAEQRAPRNWNYRRALDRLFANRTSEGPERRFTVFDVAIQNADVRVKRPNMSFAISDVAALLPRVDFSGPGLPAPRVTVSRATGTLIARDSAYHLAAEDAKLEFPTGQMNFDVARLTTGETRIANFAGKWGGTMPGYALLATGRIPHLRFEDVAFLGPRMPRSGTAAFDFEIRPVNEELTEFRVSAARIESQGSRITGNATLRAGVNAMSIEAIDAKLQPLDLALIEQITGRPLAYKGTVSGTAKGQNGLVAFDVNTRLSSRETREPLITHVTGSARLASTGFELRRVEADLRDAPLAFLRTLFPALPLQGALSGKITMAGQPGKSPLRLSLRVQLAGGIGVANGTIDFTGAVPRYDLSGRLIGVNLQRMLRNAPPAFLTARLDLEGSGRNAKDTNARVHLEGRFSGWRTGLHDTIHVAARIRNGMLAVDSAELKLATMTASARGAWHFTAPAAGSINYTVAFDPLTPFGPFIPVIGDDDAAGSVRFAGSISGEAGRMRVAGTGTASQFVTGGWRVGSAQLNYAFVVGETVPQIDVDGSARNLQTPNAGMYETVHAKVKLQSPLFSLDVRGTRAGSGGLEVVADGRIPAEGAREVVLQRARIDFGASNWALTQPATFSWAGPNTDLLVRSFEMRRSDGNGFLRLEGRVLPLAHADMRLETAALPIGDLQRLLGRRPLVSGLLSTETTLRASGGVPQLETRFTLDTAIIENVRFTQLRGDANYEAQRLTVNASAVVDTAGLLVLHAELPVALQFGTDTTARLLDRGPVRITVVSDSIALAPFAALSPQISELSGKLTTNVTITGTVQEPVMAGMLAVRDGAARLLPLNQRFDSINGLITLENRRAVVQHLVARAGGRARAAGSIVFEDLNKPELDITAVLDGIQLVGVDNQTDASAYGRVHLSGPLRSALLTGDVRLQNGFFPIPQSGTRAFDAELAAFEEDLPAPGENRRPAFYEALRIANLRVVAGDNLWFSMEDARAELTGELTVNKDVDELRLVGELSGTRGTYTLRAGPIIRRFDVTSANIRFLGGRELNPALDITARRRVIDVSGRQLDVDVRIGGTMLSPTLSLASQTSAPVAQSELLSFILFGQPSSAFGAGSILPGQAIATQTVVSGVSELVSLELEQALIEQLGTNFDIFEIRLGGERLNEGQYGTALTIGEEVGHNVFLTVESVVASLFSGISGSISPTFAVRLEWRVAPTTTVRGSYEPVNPFTVVRGYTVALPGLQRDRRYQATLELRRRWTW